MQRVWTPSAADKKRLAKQERLAKRQRELCKTGDTVYIGKPGGTGEGKRLSVPTLPLIRRSVIG